MKPVTILILPALILLACSAPGSGEKQPESTTEAQPAEISLSDAELVKSYETFVASIDTAKAENVSLAADKFREVFDQSPAEVCDKAFVSFEKFYAKVAASVEQQVWNDPKLMDINCPNIDEEGNLLPVDQRLRRFLDKVEKHGFRLRCLEGSPWVSMDREFIKKRLYSYLSPVMQQYFDEIAKEDEEWFSYDAGIVIPAKEMVDRTVFWERFTAKNPAFGFAEQARMKYKTYLTYLLIGMDNTPVFTETTGGNNYEFEMVDGLEDYYAEAYTYLETAYTKTETNKLVRPYFAAAKANDAAKITKLLQLYTKQGKMLNFENEFGTEY